VTHAHSTPRAGGASNSAHAGTGVARWDLEQFRPVLAEPQFERVRALVWEGKPDEAARELSDWLGQHPPTGEEGARRLYTLSLLQREAGSFADAAGTLEAMLELEATAPPWILGLDAELLLVETLLDAGRVEDARSLLDDLGGTEADTDADDERARTLLLVARTYALLGETGAAVDAWRKVVESAPEAPEPKVTLAELLLASATPTDARERASEALDLALPVTLALGVGDPLAARATQVVGRARALGGVPTLLSSQAQLLRLEAVVERRDFAAAEQLLGEISPSGLDPAARCQLAYLRARTLAGKSEWGPAADSLGDAVLTCSHVPELHAKILFNAGKFAAADGRDPAAVGHYGKLEELYPASTLADDARVRRARSYLDMGSVARFTELLLALPIDYPEGDMTMEGVLDLALYRMERRDFSGAAAVLERGTRAVGPRDRGRGPEESGRERYFWARCLAELGESEAALDQYETIVLELPLSYYMLHAYSRLHAVDEARAEQALARGIDSATRAPFFFPHRPEYDTPPFRRGMELLRVGDSARGRGVLDRVGLGVGTDDTLLWGLALLYDRAGEVQFAHGIARGRLSDWLGHYPEGDWQRPWEIGFPRPYADIVRRESAASGVPEWFIYGVMREESTFDASVKSHADAYGLMQLIVPTARAVGSKYGLPSSPEALKRPSVNIALGSRVLESLAKQFSQNPALAIPGYNAGPGRPRRWLRERPDTDFDLWVELIPIRETRRYTKRVLASRAAYAFLYYRTDAEQALHLPLRLTPP